MQNSTTNSYLLFFLESNQVLFLKFELEFQPFHKLTCYSLLGYGRRNLKINNYRISPIHPNYSAIRQSSCMLFIYGNFSLLWHDAFYFLIKYDLKEWSIHCRSQKQMAATELCITNINFNVKRHNLVFLPSGGPRIKKLMSVHQTENSCSANKPHFPLSAQDCKTKKLWLYWN